MSAVAAGTGVRRALAPTRTRVSARGVAFAFLVVFAASVPLEAIGNLPFGSAARAAGILAAAAGATALLLDLRARPSERTLFLFGAFAGWVALSYFWSDDVALTLTRTATFAQLLLLGWLIWQEVRTSAACTALVQAYVTGSAIACVYAIVTRQPVHGGVPRFSVGDPNDFGIVVVIGMIFAHHLALTDRSRATRALGVAFLPLGAVAVVLTASRTATVALAVALVVALFDRRNLAPRRLAVVTVLVVAMVFAVGHFASSAQLARIGSVTSETTHGTLDQRTSQWRLAFTTFSEHPMTGVGADVFRDVSLDVNGKAAPAHSSFVGVAAELGIPGLVLFLLVLSSALPRLRRLPRGLRRTWSSVAVVWLLGAVTLSWEHRKITWFLIFLLVAQADALRRTGRSGPVSAGVVRAPAGTPR